MSWKKQFFMLMIGLQVDAYSLYALDIVDIFFATIVASLPALNGILDQAIKKLATMVSYTGNGLISKVRSLGSNKWTSQDHIAKFPIQAAARECSGDSNLYRSTMSLPQLEAPNLRQFAEIELQSRPTSWHI